MNGAGGLQARLLKKRANGPRRIRHDAQAPLPIEQRGVELLGLFEGQYDVRGLLPVPPGIAAVFFISVPLPFSGKTPAAAHKKRFSWKMPGRGTRKALLRGGPPYTWTVAPGTLPAGIRCVGSGRAAGLSRKNGRPVATD